MAVSLILALLVSLLCGSLAQSDFCAFQSEYPPQYVTYYTSSPPQIDGVLNDTAWLEAEWTDLFMDISGPTYPTPRFDTRAKIRWDNNFLYVAAMLVEPNVWATLMQHDTVIYYDNDFEVFLSPDGSSHYYKEYEMNAFGTDWNLCLNKPYLNGGYENSSRVFGAQGWDDPGLLNGVYVEGGLNNPSDPSQYWSVEIAFPLAAIALNNSVELPPPNASYWRINFSRVEWQVTVVNNTYQKVPNFPEDNWVFAPTYVVDIHLPEYWAYLQFSTSTPGADLPINDPDWTIRYIAMQLYYAQLSYSQANNGTYTDNISDLIPYANPDTLTGVCTGPITISLGAGGISYVGMVPDMAGLRVAHIQDDRYLTVQSAL